MFILYLLTIIPHPIEVVAIAVWRPKTIGDDRQDTKLEKEVGGSQFSCGPT